MRDGFVKVVGWTKNSFIDFPHTIATVLFLGGCNLRCPYCHNPSIVNFQNALSISHEEIFAFLEGRKGQIEGVVISGGEPTLHAGLPLLVKEIQGLGYKVKIDSNGLLPHMIQQSKPDYFALDIKTIPLKYASHLGYRGSDAILMLSESIRIVKEMGEKSEVRITLSPGIISEPDIVEIAKMLEGVEKVFLQPFSKNSPMLEPNMTAVEPYSGIEIEHFQAILARNVGSCKIRGRSQ